jgi:DNA-binding beta-propeller fold protein YncE
MAYVSCRSAGYVAIIDIAQKKMLGGMKAGNSPTGLAVDKEGKRLYVALAKDNKIAIFDLTTRALIKEVALPAEVDFPGTLCILPNGKKLVVSSAATQAIGILNIEKDVFEDEPVIGHGTDETFFVPAM